MSFVEEIQRRIYSKTSMFGTWLPTDRVQVGEYGYVRRGRFNREGQLRQRGIALQEGRVPLVPSKLAFSDRAKFIATSSLKTETRAAKAGGGLDISLFGEGAFVYQLQDIVAKRIADKEAFFTSLFLAILGGKVKWRDEFVLIDEVREVGSATLIVLESDSGKLVLKGEIPAGPEASAPLAKVGGSLSVEVESGSIFQAIGETATTPLYGARRLILDQPDPPGPGSALSEMVAWIQEKLGLSNLRPEAVRLVDYVSKEDLEEVRCELPDANLAFSIRAERVSLDAFLELGQLGEVVPIPLPIQAEHQSRYIERKASASASG